jgi:GMP synthase-like glutamine amidotransferase
VEIDEGETLPDWREFDLIVVMGGPMGAYEDDDFPWLRVERTLLGAAATAGRACFGVCLGAQILAASIGGRAYAGASPEVGVMDVELTPAGRADPVTSVLPARFRALQWHGDTFDLPASAVVLASSPAYAHQAFRWRNAIGLQFHIEVTQSMADEWARVPAYAASLEAALGPGALPHLLAEVSSEVNAMNESARLLFERFLKVTGLVR